MRSLGKMGVVMKLAFATIAGRYVHHKKDERGFTLVEALLSFSVFCMISFSLPLMMKGFMMIKNDLVPPHYYEWSLFNESVRNELKNVEAVEIAPQHISFVMDGETILYETYDQSIRRRVNNRGHEIVLQAVDQVTFTSIRGGVHLDLEFEGGEKVEGDFMCFAPFEGPFSN
ncbi:competence type IV pilus minor pilin ComGF [Rossellomorea aquimaris]|uniref:competence type IV pilus minor pilin ComGF n=1 Tax=Rossellomorea aquimaris TaxID=189382 RepID=UPI001CFD6A70|nr:competence type IV pilus minor pilin ComGF [Rossellomorea aquimaris]